jgi:hypothetical protein
MQKKFLAATKRPPGKLALPPAFPIPIYVNHIN